MAYGRGDNMSLTTMQEILILLEDEKQVPLFRLNRWGRSSRGALSKLKSLKYAEKIEIDKDIYYQISPKGEEYFDDVLSILKNSNSWDKKWRLVMFDIPENQRAVRDRLRRSLNNLSLGILQASVWISPVDVSEKIEKIKDRLKLTTQQLKYFEVSSLPNINTQIINKAWNLPDVNEALEKFAKEALWSLKSMGKGNGDRYNAKKLIFEYAIILKNGPILPLDFIEQNEIRKKTHEIYLKLRQFIV